MFMSKSCPLVSTLVRENTLVVMKDLACSAGIEKQMKEILFSSMELIPKPMKSQMKIIVAICCLGNHPVSVFLPSNDFMKCYEV